MKKIKVPTLKLPKRQSKKIEKQGGQERLSKERISVKLKLIITLIFMAMLPMMLIAFLLASQARDGLENELSLSNASLTVKVGEVLDMRITQIEDVSKLIVSNLELLTTLGKTSADYENAYYMSLDRSENIDANLTAIQFSNPLITGIYFVKADEVIDPSRTSPIKTPETREAFIASPEYAEAIEANGRPIWKHDLLGTGDLFFLRSVRGIYSSQPIAIMVIQVSPKYFLQSIASEGLSEEVLVGVISEKGNFIVTNQTDIDNTPLSYFGDLSARLSANTSTDVVKSELYIGNGFSNKDSMISYVTLRNGWLFIQDIPTELLFGSIQAILALAMGLVVVIGIVAVVLGISIALSITKPINYIKKKMRIVEEGDLTVRSSYQGNYELGQLSHSFNEMTQNMQVLINETRNITAEVSADSEELKLIANQSAMASKEVMSAVESISEGAMEQANDAELAAGKVKELIKQMNQTEEYFNAVVVKTTKTKEASSNANKIIATLNSTTQETLTLSNNIKQDMNDLVTQFDQILNIISIIDGISEQTNLLALNAAIEAARAGDAGKGFAVVADEVRKLAVQSQDAAKSISGIVNSIYSATTKTEKMIEDGSGIFVKQEQEVKKTGATFKEIEADMSSVMKDVDDVYVMLASLEGVQNEALDSITSIAAIAQQSAAAIQEVLATGEEQTAAADHLASMAIKLGEVIAVMNDNVAKFKTE